MNILSNHYFLIFDLNLPWGNLGAAVVSVEQAGLLGSLFCYVSSMPGSWIHAPSMSLRMARWSTTRYVSSRVTMEELRVPLQWFILFPSGAYDYYAAAHPT